MHGVEAYSLLLIGPLLGVLIWAGRRLSPVGLAAGVLVVGCALWAGLTNAVRQESVGREAGLDALGLAPPAQARLADSGALDDDSSGALPGFDRWTAVYDISAHTVYLPNGRTLEAHSGLGARLDDPRYVHERMRGPTPPSVYDLELREKPFHGVRALRLKPQDERDTYGRTGLLAHTYMLGPRGDSNGCVVFKDYDVFLAAFEAGALKRLVVVTRLDKATAQQPAVQTPPSGPQQRSPRASVTASSLLSR